MIFILKTEVEGFSETFVPMFQSTGRHIPWDGTLFMIHTYIPYIPGPTQPPIQWIPGHSRGVRGPGRGVNHTPMPSAEVKERVELYLYSPSMPSWLVLGWISRYFNILFIMCRTVQVIQFLINAHTLMKFRNLLALTNSRGTNSFPCN